jgi:hypothetical protein
MKRRVVALAVGATALGVAAALAPTGVASAAGGCSADRFCAFQDANFSITMIQSAATRGQTVDVTDNLVTSVSNLRNNAWFGRDGRGALPDVTVFTFAPQTDVSNVGAGANDRIDFFIVD